ncbi:MAG: transposase [Mesorhizobium sp.]|nr:MAG: transposase [Mesorhizobium sp.]RWI63301.1 MAG: transposase [Mesorhizobium sp.]RWI82582.1 MAG: transposase [Mesorhizobium sp.]RWJ46774.1 MAG: transposase [Mesorhizobium sp.]RWJ57539.1 MAG: transposase [Mesorhizobium sp.]
MTAEPLKSRRNPRHWSDEDKARLVAEASAPGSNVSAIARSHGLDPSQVYAWRRKALTSGAVSPLTEGQVKPVRFTRFEAVGSEMVEIVVGDVVGRIGGYVDPDRLVKIMRAVRRVVAQRVAPPAAAG